MRLRSPVFFEASTLICSDKLNVQSKKCLFKHFHQTLASCSYPLSLTCSCLCQESRKKAHSPHSMAWRWRRSHPPLSLCCGINSTAKQPQGVRAEPVDLQLVVSLIIPSSSTESSGCTHSLLPLSIQRMHPLAPRIPSW